jgi:hypothetical protein
MNHERDLIIYRREKAKETLQVIAEIERVIEREIETQEKPEN